MQIFKDLFYFIYGNLEKIFMTSILRFTCTLPIDSIVINEELKMKILQTVKPL